MSTRGFVGFRRQGRLYGWYNHSDSHYDVLGLELVNKVLSLPLEVVKDFLLNRVEFVPDCGACHSHHDVMHLDWRTARVQLESAVDFLTDGLFCEYGYVLNFDRNVLELYRGWFKHRQPGGFRRYTETDDGTRYYVHKTLEVQFSELHLLPPVFEIYERLPDFVHDVYPYPEQLLLEKARKGEPLRLLRREVTA